MTKLPETGSPYDSDPQDARAERGDDGEAEAQQRYHQGFWRESAKFWRESSAYWQNAWAKQCEKMGILLRESVAKEWEWRERMEHEVKCAIEQERDRNRD